MKPVLDREKLVEEVKGFLSARYGHFDGKVTDRALWPYIRHYLTNYDEIRAALKAKVGESELYENVKVYLCCWIIGEYGLGVDPLYAAFGETGSYSVIPDRFIVDNLEATATQLILQELVGDSVGPWRRIRRPDTRATIRGGQARSDGRSVDDQQLR